MNKHKTKSPPNKKILGLVISPTRELAKQIHEICKQILEVLNEKNQAKFTFNLFIGGMNKDNDFHSYDSNGGNIIVGTPGKLREIFTCEHFKTILDIKDLEILILGNLIIFYFFICIW